MHVSNRRTARSIYKVLVSIKHVSLYEDVRKRKLLPWRTPRRVRMETSWIRPRPGGLSGGKITPHVSGELFILLEGSVGLDLQGRIIQPAIGEEGLIPARAIRSFWNVSLFRLALLNKTCRGSVQCQCPNKFSVVNPHPPFVSGGCSYE